jgi:DNA-binding LacI/PurR family transcriptional regulator
MNEFQAASLIWKTRIRLSMKRTNASKITIKDVARACGVSPQTISRVVNNRVDVSAATREKVLAIIDQMGYQPNALARGMRQSSKTLGVIIAGLQYRGIAITLHGVITAAEAHGFNLLLKELPTFDAINMPDLIQSLMSSQVEGIIYAVPEIAENWTNVQKKLTKHTPPIVFLKGSPASAPVTISIDNYSGGYAVTRHLVEQGYNHIGHISGPLEWWEARERKRGWAQALRDAGRPVENKAVVQGNWLPTSGRDCFNTLCQQYPEMDALFTANDQMALAVLHTAWEKGIPVGRQLGVTGFDNFPGAEFHCPPLTTVNQDFYTLGELAVRKLLQINSLENGDKDIESDDILLTPEVIVRQSSLRTAAG